MEQEKWEIERAERTRVQRKKFHDIPWENGETSEYLDFLFKFAGLGTLKGEGRIPPVLGKDLVWAIEHVRKYPEPPRKKTREEDTIEEEEQGWILVENSCKDLLTFL